MMRCRGVGLTVSAALLSVSLSSAEAVKVDKANKTLTFEGSVAQYDKYPQLKGAIEYGLVVAKAGKAYESVLEVAASPQELFDAFAALGLKPGTPARRDDDDRVIPPKGVWAAVLIEWEAGGAKKKARLEELILDDRTKQPLAADAFLYTGSILDENPATNKTELLANQTKNLLALFQSDKSVLLQNPVSDPAGGSSPYRINKEKLPPQSTKVTVTVSLADPAVTGARRIHARVKGKVQGVGFRDFTAKTVTELKLTGWVKNLAEGDVELVAEGPADVLQAFADKLLAGPPSSKVEGVSILAAKAGTGEFKAFEVKQ
jgi:acylphosphatase